VARAARALRTRSIPMKPAPFAYHAPCGVDEALAALDHENSRPLAGGQSLIALMNLRRMKPAALVDLNSIAELSYLCEGDGVLRIGAMTRQAALERSAVVAHGWPLLRGAVRMAGHPAVRSRGTVGGSVAHADPRAELPAALTALDARFRLRGATGDRTLTTGEMFRAAMLTAIEPGELLTEIVVPVPPAGAQMALVEHARTRGDLALAGACVVLVPGEHASIALFGTGPVPVRATAAERALLDGAHPHEAAQLAGETGDDDYGRALATAMVRLAVERASG
jgi:aerobic carbon-monoxide dehydrogenase medium subunit